MKKSAVLGLFVGLLGLVLYAVGPRKWALHSYEDFLKGKFEGISVSEDGELTLAPKEVQIEGPPEQFYLSLLQDAQGNLFLGTGHGGKIYRIAKDGTIELYFAVPEMDVFCLVQDKKGVLYAGSSPNGKVYRITGKDEGGIFFNPQEKYIWDLMLTEKGNLLAAVGESGGIYEISPRGEGDRILKSEENHILCLERSEDGDLMAGSGGKGRLYSISEGGKAKVVFESPFEEVRSIVLDRQGNIYVAAGGTVTQPQKETKLGLALVPMVTSRTAAALTVTPSPREAKVAPSSAKGQPGALYKISPEGIAKKLWESQEDMVYSLVWDERKQRVILGTGDRGRIFAVGGENKLSLLLQKDSEHVYMLVPAARGPDIFTLANNPASLNRLAAEQRNEGTYTSEVFDTNTLSSWGRISWDAVLPSGSFIQLLTRSGNGNKPNQTWSEWSPPYQRSKGEQILSPKARYIQFRANFRIQSGRASPRLQRVSLFYQQTNLAPEITKLELLAPNEVYLKPPRQEEIIWGLDRDSSAEAKDKQKNSLLLAARKTHRKGFQTVVWDASDANGDGLEYTIVIRNAREDRWRMLKQSWPEKIFVFDTSSLPDGEYEIRVEASDGPSNPIGGELRGQKTSRPFVIDNSLPVIRDFKTKRDKGRIQVTFTAEDAFSYIKEVEYLILPDSWRSVFPEDGICDSLQESFSFSLPPLRGTDEMIVIRVKDNYDNVGVHKELIERSQGGPLPH